jgi:hypothetical protein
VSGDSGFWIVVDDLQWRGFVGTSWELVKEMITDYDLWTSLALFPTAAEQCEQANEAERRERCPLTPDERSYITMLAGWAEGDRSDN